MLVFPASYSLGFWLVFLHMMSWESSEVQVLVQNPMGFFEENAKTANGYQSVHWIPTFFDMKNGGCCKIKIWFPSIYVNKTCLKCFLFSFLEGAFRCQKTFQKTNVMFQLKFPAFRFQVWSRFRLFLVWISSIPKDQQPLSPPQWLVSGEPLGLPPSVFGPPFQWCDFGRLVGVRYDTLEIRFFFQKNKKKIGTSWKT